MLRNLVISFLFIFFAKSLCVYLIPASSNLINNLSILALCAVFCVFASRHATFSLNRLAAYLTVVLCLAIVTSGIYIAFVKSEPTLIIQKIEEVLDWLCTA